LNLAKATPARNHVSKRSVLILVKEAERCSNRKLNNVSRTAISNGATATRDNRSRRSSQFGKLVNLEGVAGSALHLAANKFQNRHTAQQNVSNVRGQSTISPRVQQNRISRD